MKKKKRKKEKEEEDEEKGDTPNEKNYIKIKKLSNYNLKLNLQLDDVIKELNISEMKENKKNRIN